MEKTEGIATIYLVTKGRPSVLTAITDVERAKQTQQTIITGGASIGV